ncbi:hypothetical protein F5887DRAFT_924720 [Amanita rubescens]|nr:hypothetical protein F5887DRAFT_924720 [Amanita rubescens]
MLLSASDPPIHRDWCQIVNIWQYAADKAKREIMRPTIDQANDEICWSFRLVYRGVRVKTTETDRRIQHLRSAISRFDKSRLQPIDKRQDIQVIWRFAMKI